MGAVTVAAVVASGGDAIHDEAQAGVHAGDIDVPEQPAVVVGVLAIATGRERDGLAVDHRRQRPRRGVGLALAALGSVDADEAHGERR